ncbi:MAG: FAD-dependent monooxygenase [Alphaproteobacteria bacterium]
MLQLLRWDLLDRLMAAHTPPVRHTVFHYGDDDAVHVDIRSDHGVDFLCTPRRTVLDPMLVDATREAGIDVRHGVMVMNLAIGPSGHVVGVHLKEAGGSVREVAAGIVIGADGRQSLVARQVGAEAYVEGGHGSGYVYGYYDNMIDDGFHWYFEDGVAAGAIPTNHDQHLVFAAVHRDEFAATFRGDLEDGPTRIAKANSVQLAEDVGKAQLSGRLREFFCASGHLRQCHGAGWALVGDAAYFKDPLTAHGITDAFRDSEILSRAMIAGWEQAFADYQEERDRLSRTLFDVTDVINSFQSSMDQVKTHHGHLSDAMKAETDHIAGFTKLKTIAA